MNKYFLNFVQADVTGSSFHRTFYEAQEKRKQKFLRWGAVGVVNNFKKINLFVCIMCVYLHHTIMRRFNFFIEQKWIDRIKRDMKKHGFTSVSSFIRHIIIKFFDKNI